MRSTAAWGSRRAGKGLLGGGRWSQEALLHEFPGELGKGGCCCMDALGRPKGRLCC